MSGETKNRGARVVTGALHRVQRGKGKGFAAAPEAVVPEPAPQPARIAIMLALAHKIQRAIDAGEVKDRAEVARRMGLTRARVTQVMDLLVLSPRIQEAVLVCSQDSASVPSMRDTHSACAIEAWNQQQVYLQP